MKEKLAKAGYAQGNMQPHVEDYQSPMASFSQEGFSKTTQYIERQDQHRNMAASDVKKQAYKGRYS